MRRICIIQGHPTPGEKNFGHALARAYAQGAAAAGHEVKTIRIADLEFPILRSKQDWDEGEVPPAILKAQEAIGWVQHLCIIHPLWMGSMPRFVEGLFEQALRPGFAPVDIGPGWLDQAALSAERAHACDHGHAGVHLRWYFGAHGLKSLTQNLLLVGIAPCRTTVIGRIEAMDDRKRRKWLDDLGALGRRTA